MSNNTIKTEKDAKQALTLKNQKMTKYSVGDGLYLYVNAGGKKTWAREFKFNKKSDVIRFGIYPAMTLKEAKQRNTQISSFKNQLTMVNKNLPTI